MVEILKILGTILLCVVGFILLNVFAYLQVTWNMTPEEKEKFDEYIKENGILGHDDDFWP